MQLFTSTKAFAALLALIFLSVSFRDASAQYVTVPDPNFVTWLQNNGYAACMNGNQLDTTCVAVTGATSIDISWLEATDLTGIQYFDNLQTLVADFNNLTSLPPLPNGLTSLTVSWNQIASLPTLPDSLVTLDVGFNQLVALPDLPPTLVTLAASNNYLTELPPLPLSLLTLNILNNPDFACLPPLVNVENLNIDMTAVACLPTPNNLITVVPDPIYIPNCGTLEIIETSFGGNSYELNNSYNLNSGTNPSYLWSTGETTAVINVDQPGTYELTVNPGALCEESASFTATSGGPLTVELNDVYVPWCNWTTTFLSPIISGGDFPYSYLWSTGETTDQIGNLLEGSYSVTVTDANGLTASEDAFVTAPDSGLAIGGMYYNGDPNCNDSVSMGPLVLGGVQPYSFLWSNGETTPYIIIQAAQAYDVTVTDVDGCSVSSTGNGTGYVVNLDNITSAGCGASANGAIDISINDPFFAGPFTYIWSNGATTEDVIGLPAGTYTVTVTPIMSCPDTMEFIVPSSGGLSLSTEVTNAGCGAANGSIDLTVTGGTAPYFYSWNNASTDEDLTNAVAGVYYVTVVDINGCNAATNDTIFNVGTCGTPTNVTDLVNGTTAIINWDSQPCAVKYRVLVKQMGVGGGPWALYVVNAPDINLTLTGLNAGKTYKYKVRSVCSPTGSVLSSWSAVDTFMTTGGVTACIPPQNIVASNITQNDAIISWTPVAGAFGYQLRYRIQGAVSWTPVVISNGTSGSQAISGLSANTTYEFQMRTKCSLSPLTWSAYSTVQTFSTPLRLSDDEIVTDFTIYPNPANGFLNVVFNEPTHARISMLSIDGRILHQVDSDSKLVLLDTGELSNGMYVLRIESNAGEHHERFVIQH